MLLPYVSACGDREDLSNTGVYFLFGSDDATDSKQVYIGEAENIINRIKQHVAEKDFWTESVVFISKDNNLNKAHIKYLENRLYMIAKENKRYEVPNLAALLWQQLLWWDTVSMGERRGKAKKAFP